jgi:hypothetical protein
MKPKNLMVVALMVLSIYASAYIAIRAAGVIQKQFYYLNFYSTESAVAGRFFVPAMVAENCISYCWFYGPTGLRRAHEFRLTCGGAELVGPGA